MIYYFICLYAINTEQTINTEAQKRLTDSLILYFYLFAVHESYKQFRENGAPLIFLK